jgi:hypothetical protein
VDLRIALDVMEKRKFLTLPGLEFRPLGHSAYSQSLKPTTISLEGLVRTANLQFGNTRKDMENILEKHICATHTM